jgi:hypothetical protein
LPTHKPILKKPKNYQVIAQRSYNQRRIKIGKKKLGLLEMLEFLLSIESFKFYPLKKIKIVPKFD